MRNLEIYTSFIIPVRVHTDGFKILYLVKAFDKSVNEDAAHFICYFLLKQNK